MRAVTIISVLILALVTAPSAGNAAKVTRVKVRTKTLKKRVGALAKKQKRIAASEKKAAKAQAALAEGLERGLDSLAELPALLGNRALVFGVHKVTIPLSSETSRVDTARLAVSQKGFYLLTSRQEVNALGNPSKAKRSAHAVMTSTNRSEHHGYGGKEKGASFFVDYGSSAYEVQHHASPAAVLHHLGIKGPRARTGLKKLFADADSQLTEMTRGLE